MSHFLAQNLTLVLDSPWYEIAVALVASVCGALVGAEREKREKPAGLRTLVLVCLGSAAFTLASYSFSTSTGDSGRVAAQIVTGIGFLGAGAILHGSSSITGMTTAATIWVTAAIGIVAGTGNAWAALGLSVLVRMLLNGIYFWETRHLRSRPSSTVRFLIEPARGKTRIRVEKIMEDYRVHEVTFESALTDGGQVRGTATFTLPEHQRRDLLYALASIPEVVEIDEASPPR